MQPAIGTERRTEHPGSKRWLRLSVSQGLRRSATYAVHLIDGHSLDVCMRRMVNGMTRAEQSQLAQGEVASAALATAARRLAQLLVEDGRPRET